MMIGPDPIIRIFLMSVRLGTLLSVRLGEWLEDDIRSARFRTGLVELTSSVNKLGSTYLGGGRPTSHKREHGQAEKGL
jgi:hypothetical protein